MELTWTDQYRISAAIGGMTGMAEELQRQGYSESARMLVEYAASLQSILDRATGATQPCDTTRSPARSA